MKGFVARSYVMGAKDVCSGCACWVEEGWSYCMHCGARHIRRSSLTLSTALYRNTSGTTAVASKEHRSLRRRRHSSEEVGRQLQQWRRKSKIQEGLLHELERRNATTQRAVSTKTESDLRRVVHDGRLLIRNWPSSSASSSMLPMTGKSRKNLWRSSSVPATTKADNTAKDCSNREGNGAAGNDVGDRSRSPTSARAVYATVTRDRDELYSHGQPFAKSPLGNIGGQVRVDENFQTDNTPPEERALPRRVDQSVHERNNNNNNNSGVVKPGQQQSSGWFWGAGGGGHGGGGDGGGNDCGIAAPGEGTMAAYWREPSAGSAGKSPGGGAGIARYAVTSSADSTISKAISSSHQASFGKAAAMENPSCGDEHLLVKESSKISSNSHNSRLFVSVASAKAAVRSASNRAAELSYLLREGNNPPREECLAKAESAVRAAESAISCANERLFQLELMATAEPATQEVDGEIDGAQGAPTEDEKRPSNKWPGGSTTSSLHSSSSLSAYIEELTEQLRFAQNLQAISVTARARLSRRFALEAIAAVRIQALVRGCVSRWRERRRQATLASKKTATAFPPLGSSLSQGTDVKQEGLGKTGSAKEEDTQIETLPRTEELWWTPAEAESADDIGESESALLGAVVKLQAIVRSRLARSQTIAAVNARFVEHVDEEHQHPFYVCSETNTSQWNMPFRFASGGGARVVSSLVFRGAGTNESLEGMADSSRACGSLAESAEENEEMGPVFMKAVVKLQAVVRSRIARPKAFAAVNARFAKHFDEEHQHFFYVCKETNTSQWNQPFGYGCTRGETRQGAGASPPYILEGVETDTSATTTTNVGDTPEEDEGVAKNERGGTTNEVAGELTPCGTLDEQEAAATAIQCAIRAARARAQLAEKIVLASL